MNDEKLAAGMVHPMTGRTKSTRRNPAFTVKKDYPGNLLHCFVIKENS
jgi:hypothetical protein